ncbi:hypothetical protein ACNOYE_39890 [Nannocystaceae bacterium ST9]
MSEREIPTLLVEQLELGELSESKRGEVEAALARAELDPREALRSSNAEILRDYPAERVMAEVRRRAAQQAEPPRSRAWLPWLMVPGLAGAAALILIVVLGDRDPSRAGQDDVIAQLDPGSEEGEPTRIKGGADAHLVVDRKLGAGHERLVAGELIREGDLVQISVVPDGHTQAVILSIDGRGVVTLHHPGRPDAPVTLPAGSEVPLAESYQLDDAPGFERFILVTRSDDAAIDVGEVMAAAERLASDPARARTEPLVLVGEVWQQRSLELRKPSPGELP